MQSYLSVKEFVLLIRQCLLLTLCPLYFIQRMFSTVQKVSKHTRPGTKMRRAPGRQIKVFNVKRQEQIEDIEQDVLYKKRKNVKVNPCLSKATGKRYPTIDEGDDDL